MSNIDSKIMGSENNAAIVETQCRQDKANVEPSSSITFNNDEFIDEEKNPHLDETDYTCYGQTSAMAWVQVIVSVCVCSCTEFNWTTPCAIPIVASEWMDISLTQLNWISNVSAIFDALFSLCAAWFYDKYGIKNSIILASITTSLGSWIKCIGILVPANKSIPTKLVSVWFSAKDRGIALNLLSLGAGRIVGPIILPFIAPTDRDVPKLLIILAITSTICTVLALLPPKKPKVSPSVSSNVPRTPFLKGIKQLFKNKQFWWITIITSVSLGLNMTMTALITEVIIPYGYTEKQGGLCLSLFQIGSFLGGAMCGYWLGKTGEHFMLLKIFVPMSVFSSVALVFDVVPNSFGTIAMGCIFYGFFSRGAIPIYFELASELTYPVSESVSSCVIWGISTVNMLIFVVILDALRAGSGGNMMFSMIAAAVISAVGSLPCVWIKGDLKRLKVDNGSDKK